MGNLHSNTKPSTILRAAKFLSMCAKLSMQMQELHLMKDTAQCHHFKMTFKKFLSKCKMNFFSFKLIKL